jgi:hypothetical protein
MVNVIERFQTLQQQESTLNLYALVDGFQYEQYTGLRIQHQPDVNRPILHGTEDEPLAHAGPWLVDVAKVGEQVGQLQELEQALPSVSWLITSIDLEGLSQLLQLKLEAELPDGRKALLRFYDPRVLGNLCRTMDAGQYAEFFHFIDEWHFIYNGQRVVTGRSYA